MITGSPQFCSDWRFILDHHPHVLLVGPAKDVEPVLAVLRPYLLPPARECDCTTMLSLPLEGGTVILRDVAALDVEQQQLLTRWLDQHAGQDQVVSMSVSPLFPFVEQGSFLDTLYYRLNVVTLLLESSAVIHGPKS